MRDNFTKKTRERLAHRAGYRCSKPDCGIPTRGAASNNDGTINIGFAAHITAASPSGPRYDPMLSEAERKHHRNGIWLCGTHEKLVDSDESHFTIEELRKWKRLAESRSFLEVVASEPSQLGALTDDDHVQTAFDLILDYSKSDLAAFQQSPGWPVHPVTLNLRLLDGKSTTTFAVSGLSSAIDLYDQVAVIAAPGTGKTTALLQLTEAILANASSVAVFIPLSEWATGSDRFFQSLLKRAAFRDASEPQFELLARHGKLVLLLDGWNELDEASKRRVRNELKALGRDFPDIRVVISSRYKDFDIPINGPVVEVDLLTEEQQLEIAKSLRGLDGESLMDHACRTPGLRELVATPLYITALLKQAPGGSLPKTKEEILRSFIAEIEKDRDKLATLRQTLQGFHREFLVGIAVEATKSATASLSETEARAAVNSVQGRLKAENQIAELLQPMKVLDALVDAHMLLRSGTEVGAISLQHQQFQEWFASFHVEQVMLSAALGDVDARKTLRESILDIRMWEDAVLFACDRLSRAVPDGVPAVAHAILETLGIDPLLSAEMIWRSSDDVWVRIRDDIRSFVAKWHTPGSVDRAVNFMIATGRAEFSEFIWPLLSHADDQVHLHALRTERKFRCGVLGPDAARRVATLSAVVRGNVISEIASSGDMDGIELAASLAKMDPDHKVRSSAIESLVFRRAERFVKEILDSSPDEVWRTLASQWHASEFSDPELSARIQQEADRLFAEESDPGLILYGILAAKVHDSDAAHQVRELVERIDYSAKDQDYPWVIHRAHELYPHEVVAALLALLEQRKPVPFRVDEMLRTSDVLIDEGPLADCVLNHADDGRAATHAVNVVGPKTVGNLIDQIFLVYSRISANDGYKKSLSDEYHRLINLVSSARTDSFIQALLERAKTKDPKEIYSLTHLISRHGRRLEREPLSLAPETHKLVTAALKRWAGTLLVSPEATRGQFAEIAKAAERLESPDLVPVLLTLLSEDLKRKKQAQEEWMEARRQGQHIQNDARTCWTLQYRRAFAAIGDRHTIDAMTNRLRDPEFGFDAAHVLKDVWLKTQPRHDEFGLLKSWPDFSVVPEEYRKRQSATTEETHPFVDDIIAAISALIEPGSPEVDLLHAIKLATVAFSMPYTGKEDTIGALLRLSVPVIRKQSLLTVLVLAGEAISSELVLRGIDDLLDEAKANPWILQHQDGWRMMDWLRLLPFTDQPESVLEVLDRAKGFSTNLWNLRPLLSALGYAPSTEAETVLHELARRDERFLGDYDWTAALLMRNSLASKRFLLDLICSSSLPERWPPHVRSDLGRRLSALMSSDDDFRHDVYERFAALDDGFATSVLEYAIAEAADADGVLLLIRHEASKNKGFQSTAISRALRNVFVGHTPIEPAEMQSLCSIPEPGLRKYLFDLVINGDATEARLASQCLRTIEELRDHYGDVESEPRHPDITAGVPWPKLDMKSADE